MTPFELTILRYLAHFTAEAVKVKAALAVLLACEQRRMSREPGMTPEKADAFINGALEAARKGEHEAMQAALRDFGKKLEETVDINELLDSLGDDSKPS